MDRRFFLKGLGAIPLSQLLFACRQSSSSALWVYLLKNTLPSQLVGKFRNQAAAQFSLQLSLKSGVAELFQQLQTWHTGAQNQPSQTDVARLVSLGDAWLAPAIQQNLIQPLPDDQLQWLPAAWKALVKRDDQGFQTDTGNLWGAPYRWGATMIAYRKDKFKALGWTPTDWSDLWRSDLRGRVSLLDHPREVIGLTLKQLQQSYNTQDLEETSKLWPQLWSQLQALHQQVKFYDSTNYLQPLVLGDTWAAVGWSTDILPVLERERDIAAVIPQSGTALWADVWVQSKGELGADTTRAVSEWIEFWWEPQVAQELSQFTDALSPCLTAQSSCAPQGSQSSSTQTHLLPSLALFKRSEFLLPLPQQTQDRYRQIWEDLRP